MIRNHPSQNIIVIMIVISSAAIFGNNHIVNYCNNSFASKGCKMVEHGGFDKDWQWLATMLVNDLQWLTAWIPVDSIIYSNHSCSKLLIKNNLVLISAVYYLWVFTIDHQPGFTVVKAITLIDSINHGIVLFTTSNKYHYLWYNDHIKDCYNSFSR